MTEESYYYGECSRFMIRLQDGVYYVHDAGQLSDEDVHSGKRSPVVSQHATEAEAIAWCDKADVSAEQIVDEIGNELTKRAYDDGYKQGLADAWDSIARKINQVLMGEKQ